MLSYFIIIINIIATITAATATDTTIIVNYWNWFVCYEHSRKNVI